VPAKLAPTTKSLNRRFPAKIETPNPFCYTIQTTKMSITDRIYDEDGEFMDAEKTNGSYYIGLPGYIKSQGSMILLSSVRPGVFFQYGATDVLDYLVEYGVSRISKPEIHIMKLDIDERQTYNVSIKTHWLRLIQRNWKRVFQERKNIVRVRSQPHVLFHRQLTGEWIEGKKMPGIKGMLTY
jgi:hypothetical protein